MKSSETILTAFHNFLVSTGVQDVITGEIHKGKFVPNNQAENIEINVLTNFNGYVQRGTINLNLYVVKNADNTFNQARIEEITSQLSTLLADGNTNDYRFQIEQQSGMIDDPTLDKMVLKNIKFNFQTIR